LIGPANSLQAKETAPKTLRALFGSDNRINAVFGSDSKDSASREIDLFFGPESKVTEIPTTDDEYSIKNSVGVQKTLCLIKFEDSTRREQIIERIICRGIHIIKREDILLTPQQVEELYPNLKDHENLPVLVESLTKYSFIDY
jgi:nucleoside diphosphate kinase